MDHVFHTDNSVHHIVAEYFQMKHTWKEMTGLTLLLFWLIYVCVDGVFM